MKSALLVIILLCAAVCVPATTYTVKQDGTGDFTTIQAAVNVLSHGEIIVYPGVYHEYITLGGKSLKLKSLEAITGNKAYIDSTIICGEGENDLITIGQYNSTSFPELRGFTITNGGRGIKADRLHYGRIINCNITGNNKYGGIYACYATLWLSGVNIYNNTSQMSGGGINIYVHTKLMFDPENRCSIYNNSAPSCQDFFANYNANSITMFLKAFTVKNPTSFYAYMYNYSSNNYSLQFDVIEGAREETAADFYVSPSGNDANDGLSPAAPLKSIRLALQKIAPDSLAPHTVHLLPGVYSTSDLALQFPLSLKSNVRISGAGINSTVIMCDGSTSPISCLYQEDAYIGNFSVISDSLERRSVGTMMRSRRITLENIDISTFLTSENGPFTCYYSTDVSFIGVNFRNISSYSNGSVYAQEFSGRFINCRFDNIQSQYQSYDFGNPHQLDLTLIGDFEMHHCIFNNMSIAATGDNSVNISVRKFNNTPGTANLLITNCLFTHLTSYDYAAVMFTTSTPGHARMYNCTFAASQIPWRILYLSGIVDFKNNIMCNTSNQELFFYGSTNPFLADYSLLPHGLSSVYLGGVQEVFFWGSHNLSGDPGFLNFGGYDSTDYTLAPRSVCIDSGTEHGFEEFIPEFDLAGNPRVQGGRIDLGCYESNYTSLEPEQVPELVCASLDCYPNPFSDKVSLQLSLPKTSETSLNIYNVKGQLVRSVCSELLNKGQHDLVWDGKDSFGKPCRSGIYFCRVTSGSVHLTQKLVKLK
jgi:hypothetical protein